MYRQHRAPSIARVTSSPFEPRASRRASRGARVATRQQQQQQRGVGGASARHLGRVVDPHLAREQPDAEHVPRVIAVPPERRLDVRLGSRDVRRRQDAGMRDDHYHYSPARDLLSTLIVIDRLTGQPEYVRARAGLASLSGPNNPCAGSRPRWPRTPGRRLMFRSDDPPVSRDTSPGPRRPSLRGPPGISIVSPPRSPTRGPPPRTVATRRWSGPDPAVNAD